VQHGCRPADGGADLRNTVPEQQAHVVAVLPQPEFGAKAQTAGLPWADRWGIGESSVRSSVLGGAALLGGWLPFLPLLDGPAPAGELRLRAELGEQM
jgi:hypothetical protein